MAQITLRLDDELLATLEDEADELRRENDRLRARVDAVLDSRDERDELRRYVEDEQRYRQAGIVTRLRWFLRGMD